MYRHLLIAGMYGVLATVAVLGQYVPNPDRQESARRRAEQRERELNRQVIKDTRQPSEINKVNKPPVNTADADAARRERREAAKKLEALRQPDAADLIKYKNFLKQPRTGLFRLFVDFDCQTKYTVRVDGDCDNAVLSSSAYSFRRKDYIVNDFWDIRFKDGNLIADGFLSQEILLSLGDVPLENVSLESAGMKFLTEFKPLSEIDEAKRQYSEISKTIAADGYTYGKTAKAELNTTYVVRVIAFRNDGKKSAQLSLSNLSAENKPFWDLESDKRADVIIAFRIVSKDDNKNVTILWKELKRASAAKIVFGEKEKMTDIK